MPTAGSGRCRTNSRHRPFLLPPLVGQEAFYSSLVDVAVVADQSQQARVAFDTSQNQTVGLYDGAP